ncbi:hypothetical protein [Immundisolibacter sp.]
METTKRNASIQDIVELLQNQSAKKADFIVPNKAIRMVDDEFIVESLPIQDNGIFQSMGISTSETETLAFRPIEHFHSQICNYLGIPTVYYKRMQKFPYLLNQNVNHWLEQDPEDLRMVRTFKADNNDSGIARAFLSNAYSPIENLDVLVATLDAIKGMKGIEVDACDISETRFYARFVNRDIEIQAPELLKNYRDPNNGGGGVGKGIVAGFILKNSEVGVGRFEISGRSVVLACSNGLTRKNDGYKKRHLGTRLDEGEIIWTERTKERNYSLIMSQISDYANHFMSKEYLQMVVDELSELNKKKLERPIDVTQNIAKGFFGLTDDKMAKVLNNFINWGDASRFGVASAFTRYAQETENADEQFNIEESVYDLIPVMDNYDKPFKTK